MKKIEKSLKMDIKVNMCIGGGKKIVGLRRKSLHFRKKGVKKMKNTIKNGY